MKKQKKLLLNIFAYLMVFLSILLVSTLSVYAAQLPVNLGTASDFVILTKAGISTTGVTSIVGDIGVSPIDHTAITGFDLIGVPANDAFLTSALVTGKIYAANLVDPTPAKMTTAVSDMETAFTDAQGRTTDSSPEDTTELGVAGDISGMTIVPGLHKWTTGVLINAGGSGDPNGVTLDCSSNANGVFIFQIAQDLTVGNGAQVTLIDCKAQNIFWAVDGGVGVAIGTTAHVEGNILASKAITLNTGATLNGRALAQTAVTLDANAITLPVIAETPVLTTITLLPNTSTLTVGSTQQISATSLDQFSANINATINYATSNSSIATVNETSGLVTAVAAGSATITATSGTVSGSADIIVNAVAEVPAPSGGGSSGGGGGGGGGGSYGTSCTEYSTCNSDGTRTKTCTSSNGIDISVISQLCTPTQTNEVKPVVVNPEVNIPQTQDNLNIVQNSEKIPTAENQITGQAIANTGYKPSLWVTALVSLIALGLIIGGYFYFRK